MYYKGECNFIDRNSVNCTFYLPSTVWQLSLCHEIYDRHAAQKYNYPSYWWLLWRWKLSCHDANFVVTGSNTGCHNDNLWCCQWWQSWHLGYYQFLVDLIFSDRVLWWFFCLVIGLYQSGLPEQISQFMTWATDLGLVPISKPCKNARCFIE